MHHDPSFLCTNTTGAEKELFMKFSVEVKEVELRGIAGKPAKIISSNGMTKLLKKEQRGVIAQLCLLDVSTSESSISPDLQKVLDNHSKVFETPKGLPPIRDHDHAIHLIPGSVPPNIRPYRYPYAQKSEIEHMVAKNARGWYNSTESKFFLCSSSIGAQEGWIMAHVSGL